MASEHSDERNGLRQWKWIEMWSIDAKLKTGMRVRKSRADW